jgi:transposase
VEGLRRRPPPSAPPRLRKDQRARLPELLARGAPTYGFRRDVWTCARVAKMIYEEFGVRYHPAHVSRLLKKSRLTLQKPLRQAEQRDEDAISSWKEERWPKLKRGP